LVILVSVTFTRLRRNRFVTDSLDELSKKDAETSGSGGSRYDDAEFGQTVDETTDDDEENFSDEDINVVNDDLKHTVHRGSSSSHQSFQTLSVLALAGNKDKPSRILDSDMDPDDLPVDAAGDRLAKLCIQSRDVPSEDELNTLEIHRGTVRHLPVIPTITEMTPKGVIEY
jgi:hypothetical protein